MLLGWLTGGKPGADTERNKPKARGPQGLRASGLSRAEEGEGVPELFCGLETEECQEEKVE